MKIARITVAGTEHARTEHWGVIDGDVVRASARELALADVPTASLELSFPLAEVVLAAPIQPTTKVLCVGLNYRDHIAEMGRELPAHPVIFTRFVDSLVGPGQPVVLPSASEAFDYEGELAIVIGKGGRAIPPEDAYDHVLGYTLLNDGSLRDFQRHTIQFTAGKNFEASGSVGPYIVTADEFGAVGEQRIQTRVNGELRQDSSLDQLLFDVPRLISYISTWTPLRSGDIIATGTPSGVGASFDPPRFLREGDRVDIHVDGLGTLSNPVAAEA